MQKFVLYCYFIGFIVGFAPIAYVQANSVHVHGEAHLAVIYEGENLMLELETPAMNVLGFEHAPHTQKEKSKLEDAKKILKSPESVLTLNSGCSLQQMDIDFPFSEKKHRDEDHEHHSQHDHAHSDVKVRFQWQCKGVARLNIKLHLFERFSNIEKIHAQWIAFDRQDAKILNKESNVLEIGP